MILKRTRRKKQLKKMRIEFFWVFPFRVFFFFLFTLFGTQSSKKLRVVVVAYS